MYLLCRWMSIQKVRLRGTEKDLSIRFLVVIVSLSKFVLLSDLPYSLLEVMDSLDYHVDLLLGVEIYSWDSTTIELILG